MGLSELGEELLGLGLPEAPGKGESGFAGLGLGVCESAPGLGGGLAGLALSGLGDGLPGKPLGEWLAGLCVAGAGTLSTVTLS